MAQFIVRPPLHVVVSVFRAATSRELAAGVSWMGYDAIPVELLESLRPYIRPCHQDVLDRTLAGESPLTLLRQLVRPHGLRIETLSKGWRIVDPLQPCVAVAKGRTVDWA
jgi:hypothetical protein